MHVSEQVCYHMGSETEPDERDKQTDRGDIDILVRYVTRCLPGLVPVPAVVESCMYTVSRFITRPQVPSLCVRTKLSFSCGEKKDIWMHGSYFILTCHLIERLLELNQAIYFGSTWVLNWFFCSRHSVLQRILTRHTWYGDTPLKLFLPCKSDFLS